MGRSRFMAISPGMGFCALVARETSQGVPSGDRTSGREGASIARTFLASGRGPVSRGHSVMRHIQEPGATSSVVPPGLGSMVNEAA
jgi:hypothetical protein